MSRAEVFDSQHLPRNGAWGSGVLQAVNTFAEVTSETSLVKTEIQSLSQFFIHSLNTITEHLCGAWPFAIYFTHVMSSPSPCHIGIAIPLAQLIL